MCEVEVDVEHIHLCQHGLYSSQLEDKCSCEQTLWHLPCAFKQCLAILGIVCWAMLGIEWLAFLRPIQTLCEIWHLLYVHSLLIMSVMFGTLIQAL